MSSKKDKTRKPKIDADKATIAGYEFQKILDYMVDQEDLGLGERPVFAIKSSEEVALMFKDFLNEGKWTQIQTDPEFIKCRTLYMAVHIAKQKFVVLETGGKVKHLNQHKILNAQIGHAFHNFLNEYHYDFTGTWGKIINDLDALLSRVVETIDVPEEDKREDAALIYARVAISWLIRELLQIYSLKSWPEANTPLGMKLNAIREKLETEGLKQAYGSSENFLEAYKKVLKSFDTTNAVSTTEDVDDDKKSAKAAKREAKRANAALSAAKMELQTFKDAATRRTTPVHTGCGLCKSKTLPKHPYGKCPPEELERILKSKSRPELLRIQKRAAKSEAKKGKPKFKETRAANTKNTASVVESDGEGEIEDGMDEEDLEIKQASKAIKKTTESLNTLVLRQLAAAKK
ncbi:hypothetical protein BCR33DRAFT_725440 [Rhizoclosmatium globosum]|uniref:Uncharacterized protein n=1 Tax=Rhizoclosmatium globosum TaxID=329046 RepID=A0A1Y2AYJ5_9FUNG|nr:hypothetical protein BCR33DRAFT_725440 [Rhizoclosmatium globosum]|eukprot:ORY27556.1 hypothetical protein BCR33DRAFT_725440 [Rhizoclosmatium globosum]